MKAIGTGLLTNDDVVARFWSRVVRDAGDRECWDWVGAYLSPDYFQREPVLRYGRTGVSARGFAWALMKGTGRAGRVPDLVPTCGNYCCVRPEHMVLGSWTGIPKVRLQRLFRAWSRDGDLIEELARAEGISKNRLEKLFNKVAYADTCMARVRGRREMTKWKSTAADATDLQGLDPHER